MRLHHGVTMAAIGLLGLTACNPAAVGHDLSDIARVATHDTADVLRGAPKSADGAIEIATSTHTYVLPGSTTSAGVDAEVRTLLEPAAGDSDVKEIATVACHTKDAIDLYSNPDEALQTLADNLGGDSTRGLRALNLARELRQANSPAADVMAQYAAFLICESV
ncbi:hypothetical protein [Labedaea rhizosphaerae]|uniref:Uncharacterized protein n=1 Tax=Labedaea rhizosphaerae TaxID=598644 RepID=A0A4R6RVU4_LABRH|nr:hypothetical protein [Labedaea rhizosphaerae]TDP91121.1 hypothetical protein EV186_109113 [Labedaea rhizosphaerae]